MIQNTTNINYNCVYIQDKSVVVSSPTGSGKTVIFELAIIRFLEMLGKFSDNLQNFKIIYGKLIYIMLIYTMYSKST